MKINRNGYAEPLSDHEFQELMEHFSPQDKLLFGLCYYTSSRISEVLKLTRGDILGDRIVFRAATTKTKKTKEVKVSKKLAKLMLSVGLPKTGYLFPGRDSRKHRTRQSADLALRKACDYLGFVGISTHSFRRTSLTKMYHAGTSLSILRKRSGHASPESLALYIKVDQLEVDAAGELL